jgi:hypothetical protein
LSERSGAGTLHTSPFGNATHLQVSGQRSTELLTASAVASIKGKNVVLANVNSSGRFPTGFSDGVVVEGY